MDISSYIASGILEAYVLGEVSPQEAREVSCLSHIYPEIQQELEKLQKGLEGLAQQYRQEPPTHLKAKMLATLEGLEAADSDVVPVTAPPSEPEAIVKPLFQRGYIQAIAAGLVLLAGLFVGSIMSEQEVSALKESLATLQQDQSQLQENLDAQAAQLALITTPNSKIVDLAGTPNAEGSSLRVLWQPETGASYLLASNLPILADDKDYQLWALIDGKPVDLGVIPRDKAGMIQMKMTGRADAFAVTREPKGGSVSPTLSDLMVVGEVG